MSCQNPVNFCVKNRKSDLTANRLKVTGTAHGYYGYYYWLIQKYVTNLVNTEVFDNLN